MNMQPSKLSIAANQVWQESTNLFRKAHDVKIDLGLDKTLSKAASTTEGCQLVSTRHIFGSKLSERSGKNTEELKESGDTPNDVSSIFKKISQQAPSGNLWKTASKENKEDSSQPSDRLKASIDEFTKKTQVGTELNSAEPVTTGEENERNLANISCKFFCYNVETKTWVERGMGAFRINQNKDDKQDIRLVGRSSGSQRVLINSKIFAGMVLEQINEKRLKISAQNPDVELPQLFLIQSSPASIATVLPMLEKYVARTKSTITCTTAESRKRKPSATANDSDDGRVEEKLAKKNDSDSDDSSS